MHHHHGPVGQGLLRKQPIMTLRSCAQIVENGMPTQSVPLSKVSMSCSYAAIDVPSHKSLARASSGPGAVDFYDT